MRKSVHFNKDKPIIYHKLTPSATLIEIYEIIYKCMYSTDMHFLHQLAERLPVPGCTKTHGYHVKNKPSTSMTQRACESKLPAIIRSSMHPCPGNKATIGCMVVYDARAANALSAGIKC